MLFVHLSIIGDNKMDMNPVGVFSVRLFALTARPAGLLPCLFYWIWLSITRCTWGRSTDCGTFTHRDSNKGNRGVMVCLYRGFIFFHLHGDGDGRYTQYFTGYEQKQTATPNKLNSWHVASVGTVPVTREQENVRLAVSLDSSQSLRRVYCRVLEKFTTKVAWLLLQRHFCTIRHQSWLKSFILRVCSYGTVCTPVSMLPASESGSCWVKATGQEPFRPHS